MKKSISSNFRKMVVGVLLASSLLVAQQIKSQESNSILFQYASINSLMQGYYDGKITVGELRKKGSCGIGTYNTLNGEMIYVDNVFYQSQMDGSLKVMSDTTHVPYAVVVDFKPKIVIYIDKEFNYNDLENYLDSVMPNKNLFVAMKFEGEIKEAKLRTIPRQQRPYKKLLEVIKDQVVYKTRNEQSIMFGFRSPKYAKEFSVVGYHCHTVTASRKIGGHVLDCSGFRGKIYLQYLDKVELSIPSDDEFSTLPLGEEQVQEVKKIEQ
jgi:acetolactate decarboxylase